MPNAACTPVAATSATSRAVGTPRAGRSRARRGEARGSSPLPMAAVSDAPLACLIRAVSFHHYRLVWRGRNVIDNKNMLSLLITYQHRGVHDVSGSFRLPSVNVSCEYAVDSASRNGLPGVRGALVANGAGALLKAARALDEMAGEMSASWLCPTEEERRRVTEASPRARMIRTVGSGAVGVTLLISAPWLGWWTLILFALSALNLLSVDRRMARSSHPERVSVSAILFTLALLAAGVVL